MELLLRAIEINESKEKLGYIKQEIKFVKATTYVPRGFAAVSYKDYKKVIRKKGTTKAGYKKQNWKLSECVRTAIISTHFTDDKFKDQIEEKNGIKRMITTKKDN